MKKAFFFFFVCVFAFTPSVLSKTQSAKVAVDVLPGKWKAIRLKDLPKSSSIKVEINCDGPLVVLLVNEDKYNTFPNIKRSLLQKKIKSNLIFSVAIPATGNYYLIFDNINGIKKINLDAIIYGSSDHEVVSIQQNTSEEMKETI